LKDKEGNKKCGQNLGGRKRVLGGRGDLKDTPGEGVDYPQKGSDKKKTEERGAPVRNARVLISKMRHPPAWQKQRLYCSGKESALHGGLAGKMGNSMIIKKRGPFLKLPGEKYNGESFGELRNREGNQTHQGERPEENCSWL